MCKLAACFPHMAPLHNPLTVYVYSNSALMSAELYGSAAHAGQDKRPVKAQRWFLLACGLLPFHTIGSL